MAMAMARQLLVPQEADTTFLEVEAGEPVALEAAGAPECRAGARARHAGMRRTALLALVAMLAGAGIATACIDRQAPWRLLAKTEDSVGLRGKIFNKKQVDIVLCSNNIAAAIYRVAQIGVNIRASVLNCANLERPTDFQRRLCASRIQGAISNAASLAGQLAGAAASCAAKPSRATRKATCAAGVLQVLQGVTGLSQAATDVTYVCNLWWRDTIVPPNGGTPTTSTQWLPGYLTTTRAPQSTFPPNVPTLVPPQFYQELEGGNNQWYGYEASIVNCWASAGVATTYMVRASLGIYDAVSQCSPLALAKNGTKAQKRCTVNIMVIIYALADTARFLSSVVGACAANPQLTGDGGQLQNTGAACSAAVMGITSNIFKMTSPLIVMDSICPANISKLGPRKHRAPFFGFAR